MDTRSPELLPAAPALRGSAHAGQQPPHSCSPPPPSPADPRVCVTLELLQSGTFPCFARGIFQRDQLPCLLQSWHLLPKVMTVTSAARGTPRRCLELSAARPCSPLSAPSIR